MSEDNDLIEIARRIDAEFDAVAAKAVVSKPYRRTYEDGAAIISRITHAPYSAETLRKSDIHRIYVGREARLADEDLIALGERILDEAVKRRHQGSRRR